MRFVSGRERFPVTYCARQNDSAARLVRRARAGDEAAFRELYARYHGRTCARLTTVLGDHQEAEDAAQEVFVRLHRALPRFDDEVGPFSAWLDTITRNEGRRRLAKLARVGRVLDDADEVFALRERELARGASTDPAELLDRDRLDVAQRLPAGQRHVLALRFVMDLEQERVAQLLDKSPDAVRKVEARAKAALRLSLQPHAAHANTRS